MKKKVNVFGKAIPVFAIVLISFAIVSAMLFGVYGSVTGNVIVLASMNIAETNGAGQLVSLDSIHGGEATTITFDVKNSADVEIWGQIRTIISNDGISVNDFDISTIVDEGSWVTDPFNSLDEDEVATVGGTPIGEMIESVTDTGNTLVILSTVQPWQAGKSAWTFTSEITFKPNAVGTYGITVELLPVETPTVCEYSVEETGTPYPGLYTSTVTLVTITNEDCSTVNALKSEKEQNFAVGGWAGWSCTEIGYLNAVGGGVIGNDATVIDQGLAEVGADAVDGVDYPVYPHYTYTSGEEGWVVRAGDPVPTSIYVLCAA